MIEVLVLGRLEIRLQTTGTPVVISQPKRAALLAYLAVAEPRGLHRRDTLLALFWPDLDQAKARAALNQALYALRQSLGVGDDVIVSRGEGEVGLDWEQVQCDAVTLREALTAGRSEDAMALYRGPLLAGFHVSGTPEFERWLDTERPRLHERVSEAAWSLAEVETDPTRAARLARQAAAFSPEDETIARRLISFLVDRDDRAGAFRAYRAFADHLRHEYDTEPSQETHALIADLEATGETAALGAQATDASESSVAVAWPDAIPAPTPERRPGPLGWLGRLLANPVYLLAAVGVMAIAAIALGIARMGDKLPPPVPRSFVVFPFSLPGDDTTLAWLATGIATMLTHDLEAWSEVRVLDPRRIAALADSLDIAVSPDMALGDALRLARVGRAETAVLGEIVGHAGTVEIVLRQYDGQSGNQVGQSERVAGAADEDVRILIDGLAARVLDLKGAGNITPDLRAATTASLDAYRNYLEGLAHLYSWELDDAVVRFQAAIDLDSTFALAYYRLGLAKEWENPDSYVGENKQPELSAAAVRYSDRLTWRARQHVLAQNAFYHDDFMLARQLYGELIAADSSDAEAWFFLADVEVSDGKAVRNPNGRLVPRGNWNLALEWFQRAVELDPRFQLGYGDLFDILMAINRGGYIYFEPARDVVDDDNFVLEGLVYFYWAWRDSIVWIPIDDPAHVSAIIHAYKSDSVVDILPQKAMRLARRWSNAAPDKAQPHAVLRDLHLERRAYRRALDEHRALLRIKGDTTPVDRMALGELYLASAVYDTAVAVTEEALALLKDSAGGPGIRFAANVFIARGQPSRALQVISWSLPDDRVRWVPTADGSIEITESMPLLWQIWVLGSTGAAPRELRAALDSLREVWEAAYTPQELEALYRVQLLYGREMAPALLVLWDDPVRDWFARAGDSVSAADQSGIFQAWRSYAQFRSESLAVATRSFEAAVDQMNRYYGKEDPEPFTL